jgi:hypothetical protein
MDRKSSVGIATVYMVDVRGNIPEQAGLLSLIQSLQTGSGTQPASYPIGTGLPSPGYRGRNVKLTTYLHLIPRSGKEELL